MKRYEYFDHTADTLFRAYGSSFEEALGNVVLAVYNVIVDTDTVHAREEKTITLEAKTKEALVYDIINELIYLQDAEGFIGCGTKKITLEKTRAGWKVTLIIQGDSQLEGYDVFGQIKSATYHEMILSEENDNVFIQAVLDL